VRTVHDGSFELNLAYFRHHRESVPYQWDGGSPRFGALYSPALEDLLGPARRPDEPITQKHRNLARSTQAVYESATNR
jgi:carbamoyltransferase